MTPTDRDPYTGHTRYASHALTPTDAAIAAYRAFCRDPIFNPPPTLAQVRLIAEHCQDFISAYTYPVDEVNELRRRVLYIRTLAELANWLWDCRQTTRLEPL